MKFLSMIWLKCLRNFWSSIRWIKERKEVSKDVIKVNDNNLVSTLRDVYSHFKWTMDDWTQLFDSMQPASYLYNQYLECKEDSSKVLDDCDGYHTIIYHILKNNGYDVALITVATKPITQSHTMVVIRDINENGGVSYRVVNYMLVKGPYKTIEEFVDNYNYEVIYWCLDKYNYETNKFYGIDREDF